MKTVKFIKGPGYLYDLFTMFVLYFNQETYLSEQINQNKALEDTEHFNRILNEMKTVPEELRIFFQLRENKRCFFTTRYFHQNVKGILAGLSVEDVQNSLNDHKKVIENVVEYYFEVPASEIDYDDPQFIWTMGKLIRESAYDVILKNYLYQFFLDPIPVIQTLSNELGKKEVFLSKIHLEKDSLITKVQNDVDLEKLEKKAFNVNGNFANLASFDQIVISVCAAHKNLALLYFVENTALILLGSDYDDFWDYISARTRTPELAQFGIALGEPNRIQILDLIHEKGEISVAEIRAALNLSHTNAYYHITLLLRSNLLISKNRGRTIFYSLNYDCFSDIGVLLNKYKPLGGEK